MRHGPPAPPTGPATPAAQTGGPPASNKPAAEAAPTPGTRPPGCQKPCARAAASTWALDQCSRLHCPSHTVGKRSES